MGEILRKIKVRILRSRWQAPGFDSDTIKSMEADLKNIAKRDVTHLRKFINAVNEHYRDYKTWAPSESEMRLDDDRERVMTNIEDTARRFAAAVQSIDQVMMNYLKIEYFNTYRRENKSEDEFIVNTQSSKSNQELDDLLAVGKVAERLSQAIHNILKVKNDNIDYKKPAMDYRKPASLDQHIKKFIQNVAHAYAIIYNETPSNKIDGVFFKTIKIILEHAKIELLLGEKKLRSIINKNEKMAPRPKRGPKPRGS